METIVEVKETRMAGPKYFGMMYDNRTLTLFGLTPEAADAIQNALSPSVLALVTPAGIGEYARYKVAFPIDRIGVAAYTPERKEFAPGTVYRGPAIIVETADRTKKVIIIGVRRMLIKWQPASTPLGRTPIRI